MSPYQEGHEVHEHTSWQPDETATRNLLLRLVTQREMKNLALITSMNLVSDFVISGKHCSKKLVTFAVSSASQARN